jgi:hypothetical protein
MFSPVWDLIAVTIVIKNYIFFDVIAVFLHPAFSLLFNMRFATRHYRGYQYMTPSLATCISFVTTIPRLILTLPTRRRFYVPQTLRSSRSFKLLIYVQHLNTW